MTDPTSARPGTADELREEFARAMYASDYPSGAWDSDATLVREEYRALADAVVATDGAQRLLAVEQRVRDLTAVYASDPYCWTKGDDIAASMLAVIVGDDDA